MIFLPVKNPYEVICTTANLKNNSSWLKREVIYHLCFIVVEFEVEGL